MLRLLSPDHGPSESSSCSAHCIAVLPENEAQTSFCALARCSAWQKVCRLSAAGNLVVQIRILVDEGVEPHARTFKRASLEPATCSSLNVADARTAHGSSSLARMLPLSRPQACRKLHRSASDRRSAPKELPARNGFQRPLSTIKGKRNGDRNISASSWKLDGKTCSASIYFTGSLRLRNAAADFFSELPPHALYI